VGADPTDILVARNGVYQRAQQAEAVKKKDLRAAQMV
jgi:hypothetical protein